MKKILLRLTVCLMIVVVLVSQTTVLAATGTYRIDEMELSVTIPSGYSVITRNMSDNDPIFNELGISKSTLMAQFKTNGIYLNAISNTNNEEIVVTNTKNDLSNFTLLSDTVLETIASTLINEYTNLGIEVVKYDIYQHSQAKFVRIYWIDEANSTHGLQYYTIYNGNAMNFTIRSYEGSISSRQESIIKAIVDSVKYDSAPPVIDSGEDTDSFVYTDSDSGVSFTVPENWVQEEFYEEREFIDVKFASTKEDGLIITFASMDVWGETSNEDKIGYTRSDYNNSLFNKEDFAENLGLDGGSISTVIYNGVEYYKYEMTQTKEVQGMDITVTMTQLTYLDNGWMYVFQFGATSDNKFYSDFENLMKSVAYSTSVIDGEDITSSINNINFDDLSISDTSDNGYRFELNVPLLLLSIVITIVAYGAFPIVFAKLQNKTITKKRYRMFCYGINIAVMIIFIVINGEPANGAPYLLWTSIFSSVGIKILSRRGVIGDNE